MPSAVVVPLSVLSAMPSELENPARRALRLLLGEREVERVERVPARGERPRLRLEVVRARAPPGLARGAVK